MSYANPKLLVTASIQLHIDNFHLPYLRMLHQEGWEIHTAARGAWENWGGEGDFLHRHQIPFCRSPLNRENIRAYHKLKNLIEKEDFDYIHCHTPVAGFLTRLAARQARERGARVLYTAHGFHFYRGAPLWNRLVYRAAEQWAARYTDTLILINEEDYGAAQAFPVSHICLTHGVGVDDGRFIRQTPARKAAARETLDIPPDAFVLIYPAEFVPNKNQQLLLEIVAAIGECIPTLLLILPGGGPQEDNLRYFASGLQISDKVRFLPFCDHVETLMLAADLDVATSRREGLSTHVAEALTTGLPVVGTHIRGHRELVTEGENGFLFAQGDVGDACQKIITLYEDKEMYARLSEQAALSAAPYRRENTLKEMWDIYGGCRKRATANPEAIPNVLTEEDETDWQARMWKEALIYE